MRRAVGWVMFMALFLAAQVACHVSVYRECRAAGFSAFYCLAAGR